MKWSDEEKRLYEEMQTHLATAFVLVWKAHADLGDCDELDSAEYQRLFRAFLKSGWIDAIGEWIVDHANRAPGGTQPIPLPIVEEGMDHAK